VSAENSSPPAPWDNGASPDGGTAGGKPRALLDAAARILAEEGPDAVSVRRVAAEAGTSTMGVYTWYGGKPQLMRALFREAFSRFRDRLLGESAGADPLAVLIALSRAYRAYALTEPDLYAVMFGRTTALFDPGPEDVLLAAGTFEILVTAVRRCAEAGILRCDPRHGAWQLWAAAHGVVSLEPAQRSAAGTNGGDAPGGLGAGQTFGGQDVTEAFAGLMRTMLAGLGADEASVAATLT
jgi:AcrR family transcriptional regulator